MQIDPLPDVVHVTVFMECLCPAPVITEVFCVHPTILNGVVDIAHNANNNFKLAKLGWNGYNPIPTRAYPSSMKTLAFFRPEVWTLAMLKVMVNNRHSFKILYNDVTFVTAISAEALST